jgi:uncharacterized protein involved in outer membrane biogenesis
MDMISQRKPRRARRFATGVFAVMVLVVVLVVLLWNWDWFIPIVEAQASTALGRNVTITHLHVRLGRNTTVVADDVVVANPNGFPQAVPLARIGRLSVVASVTDYLHGRGIVLPNITVDHPDIHATALANGQSNFKIALASKPGAKPSAPPQIGDLQINDGTARIVDPAHKSDFTLAITTRAATEKLASALVVDARGTYAAQPITGRFVGGALLSLRDAAHPYPIDLHVANGPTKVSMVGTVENPANFAGARVKLTFSGPDMSMLFPLTGIPIPPTPPFSIAGNVDYSSKRIRFTDFAGRVGSSDLEGDITVDPHAGTGGRPDVIMDLSSRRLDLTDLGGFIGTSPGRKSTPGQTVAQKQALAKTEAKKTLLPDTPINLPKLRAADIHLKYRGEHIENTYTPFDKLVVSADVIDGKITLHPLDFVVGSGNITSSIALAPGAAGLIHANADIAFQHIELARVMQATHAFKGNGIVGGEAKIDADGNSFAGMMGHGSGELKLVLVSAGKVSALLVDIAGLEFGNALLSALGIPNQAQINCFVTDLPMKDGIVDTKALLLDTEEARVTGRGTIDFRNQTLDYALTTRSKHFSIGSLPGPIDITGPLGSPSIRPGTEVVARAGAAAGLGVLLTPLGALLPTIQFGVGNDNACVKAESAERQPLRVPPHAPDGLRLDHRKARGSAP